ncbi:MAG TPA: hypothetical protein VFH58_09290 [Acidimicrobiales bacterium]|nr:hypothetical protein [Acidimicrobiales bacterium]
MRRRLLRLAVVTVVLPLAVKAAESTADRLEAVNGPSAGTRLLRHGSRLGRRFGGRGGR